MSNTVTTSDVSAAADTAMTTLGKAWNEGDGPGFGASFSADADFVDIRGDHHRGRQAIAAGHQAIFDSIYTGSTVEYRVGSVRTVAPGIVVAVVDATLVVPTGPLAGTNQSRITALLAEQDGEWMITSFHNTLRQATTNPV